MKRFIMTFIKRGALFAAGGPVIVAIVYSFLLASGDVDMLSTQRVIREILTSTLLAFIAAGISAIHTVDKLQSQLACLIQGSVLFLDYFILYLVNGWLPFKWQSIILFTVIFAAVFAAIWVIALFSIKRKIKKMNRQLN